MTWSINYDSELGIIRCVYAGRVTADDFKEGTKKTILLTQQFKTKLILIDDSKLEYAVGTSEILEMPKYYHDWGGGQRPKIALVLPPSGKIREDVIFYETVCRNRHWRIKGFNEHQEAIDWLLRIP